MSCGILSSLNLLLVESVEEAGLGLIEHFSQYPANTVKWVRQPEKALSSFAPTVFDCAIIDIDIAGAGLNGLALACRLRENDPDLTLILTSCTYSSEKVRQVFDLGFDDFLLKPLTMEALPHTISKARLRHAHSQEKQSHGQQYAKKLERLNLSLLGENRETDTVVRLAQQLDNFELSDNIYGALTKLAAAYCEAGQAAVMMLEHESGSLLLLAEHGFGSQFTGQQVATMGRGLCGKVAAEAQPMLARPGMDQPPEVLPTRGMCMALPIYMHNLMFGVLLVADKKTDFSARDFFLLNFLLNKVGLEIENRALYEYIGNNLYSTLAALITAMEAKDLYTRQHSQRVTSIALLIGQTMGLNDALLNSLRLATYLHDIGKIGIKDDVLLKPARLSDEQYKYIQQHSVIGDSIISPMELPWEERAIVLHHHERWDGLGYPHGLEGDAIPVLARIVAVADTYDAITSSRPYRPASSSHVACMEINKCAGSQFDPQIVNYFLQAMKRLQAKND